MAYDPGVIRQLAKRTLARPMWGRALGGRGGATIALCYHNLREPHESATWPRISTADFDRHLAYLGRLGRFITPEDLPGELDGPHGPGLRILLSFDDGYANQLKLALPILRRHNAPAQFFVCTDNLESGALFWFDRVEAALQQPELEAINLQPFGLGNYRFRTDSEQNRWLDVDRVLRDIKDLGNEDHPQVRTMLDWMEAEYGGATEAAREPLRPLTPEELRVLAADPLVHIGSHAHHHRVLPSLSPQELANSLVTSKQVLEAHIQCPVTSLAYPNGDYDTQVLQATLQAGYTQAFTVGDAIIPADAPRLAMPRHLVGGFDDVTTLGYLINCSLLAARRA